jgi:hypothetical protein
VVEEGRVGRLFVVELVSDHNPTASASWRGFLGTCGVVCCGVVQKKAFDGA